MGSACYVYAILPADTALPAGLTGLDGKPLWTVPSRALAAAVGAPGDPGGSPPQASMDRLLHHEAIVEAIGHAVPSLPVRFGMVLADAAAVARALDERATVLMDDLRRVGGRVELGVTLLAEPTEGAADDDGALGAHERGSDPAIAGSASLDRAKGAGGDYLWARLAHHQREAESHTRGTALAVLVDGALGALALDRRVYVCPAPRLLLRVHYLLDPCGVEDMGLAFDALRTAVRAAHPDVRCLLSGPWPPYTFVTSRSNGSQAVATPAVNSHTPSVPPALPDRAMPDRTWLARIL